MKIYFANGLFSDADLAYNEKIVKTIRNEIPGIEVYLPQENMSINDKSKSASASDIYLGDAQNLDESDILVAVLDGVTIDPGVAAEIGYMRAKNKTILALYTDTRESSKTINPAKVEQLEDIGENQFPYLNLFVTGAVKSKGKIFNNVEDLILELKEKYRF